MKFAQMNDNRIATVGLFDSAADALRFGYTEDLSALTPEPGVGWLKIAEGQFEPPAADPGVPPLTWATAPAQYFWMDQGPFLDRFAEKRHAVLASADPDVRAVVMDLLFRQYIDIKRADVAQALDLLIAKGLITAAEKVTALQPLTSDYERHLKGLPQPGGVT